MFPPRQALWAGSSEYTMLFPDNTTGRCLCFYLLGDPRRSKYTQLIHDWVTPKSWPRTPFSFSSKRSVIDRHPFISTNPYLLWWLPCAKHYIQPWGLAVNQTDNWGNKSADRIYSDGADGQEGKRRQIPWDGRGHRAIFRWVPWFLKGLAFSSLQNKKAGAQRSYAICLQSHSRRLRL